MSNSRYHLKKKKPVATAEEASKYFYNSDIYNSVGFASLKLHYNQIKLVMTALEHYSFLLYNCLDKSDYNKSKIDEVFLTYHSLFAVYARRHEKHELLSIAELNLSDDFKYHVAWFLKKLLTISKIYNNIM